MKTTPQPPAPSKWAMGAANEILSLRFWPDDSPMAIATREAYASIITRHHAVAQAETVALLEECADDFTVLAVHLENRNQPSLAKDIRRRAEEVRTHLAQLKEGAP